MKLFLSDIVPYTYESMFTDTICSKFFYKTERIGDGEFSFTNNYIKKEVNWELNNPFDHEEKGCVYFLLKDEEVVYIGQTKNKTRIRVHKKNGIDFNSVRFMPTKNNMHKRIEYKLLSRYATKYNRTGISKFIND